MFYYILLLLVATTTNIKWQRNNSNIGVGYQIYNYDSVVKKNKCKESWVKKNIKNFEVFAIIGIYFDFRWSKIVEIVVVVWRIKSYFVLSIIICFLVMRGVSWRWLESGNFSTWKNVWKMERIFCLKSCFVIWKNY